MPDPIQHPVDWSELDQEFSGLATGKEHQILVQREAIPIVFVPGIMGTRLRRTGTHPEFPYPKYWLACNEPRGTDDLPLIRWDPDSSRFMIRHYIGEGPRERRAMMISSPGGRYQSDYLEPDDANPVGNGTRHRTLSIRRFTIAT